MTYILFLIAYESHNAFKALAQARVSGFHGRC